MKYKVLFGLTCGALISATPAIADDYRGQLKKMNFVDLLNVQPSSLDRKQLKTYLDVKKDRENRVARSYEGTQLNSDPYTASTSLSSSVGLNASTKSCSSEADCVIFLAHRSYNNCRKSGFGLVAEYQFCRFDKAYALGGVALPVERLSSDVTTSRTSRLVGMPKSCTTCVSTQRTIYDYKNNFSENYVIGIPLAVLRSFVNRGDLSIRLDGSGGQAVVGVEQEYLIGYLRRFDEEKVKLFSKS